MATLLCPERTEGSGPVTARLTPELLALLGEVRGRSGRIEWMVLVRNEGAPDPRVGGRRFADTARAHRWARQATGGARGLTAWVVRCEASTWDLEGRYLTVEPEGPSA